MKEKPYREATISSTLSCIKSMARKTNLDNPESVKEYIATANVSDNRKGILIDAMARYYDYRGIPFQRPVYRKILRLPFIPVEREVDDLISGAGNKVATFLLVLKDTGLRCGEAWALKWVDLDSERQYLTCTPEKNSNPRQLKISNRLISMLNSIPRQGKWVFHTEADPLYSLVKFRRTLQKQRRRISEKLQIPRIQQITFKTFRHFKATMGYHKTKDILHVMQLLGHKNIRNTLVYTHLLKWESDEFVSKVASNQKEITELIEAGFDFILQKDGLAYFRKRK